MSIRIKKKSRLYRVLELGELVDNILFGFLGGRVKGLMLADKIMYAGVKGMVKVIEGG